jgi:uncharacterized protein (DUF302 family)
MSTLSFFLGGLFFILCSLNRHAVPPAVPGTEIDSLKGIVSLSSSYSVVETLNRLESELTTRGLMIFTRIDFTADAKSAGLEMRPTELLIFGNPKAGTPLMNTEPLVAIDLPLKALAWEDPDGHVWLSYNMPEYLGKRHNLPSELVRNLGGVVKSLERAAE